VPPEDINYPTDLKLLNKAREQSEQIIYTLHKPVPKGGKKPRTCRQRARKKLFKSIQKSEEKRRAKPSFCSFSSDRLF